MVFFGNNRTFGNELLFGKYSLLPYLYGLYLVFSAISIFWSNETLTAIQITVKNAVYFICFLVITVLIAKLVQRRIFVPVAGVAALFSITAFIVYFFSVFLSLGRNLFEEYYRAFVTIDIHKIMFDFYPVLFNIPLIGANDDITFLTSLRNSVVSGFVLDFILLAIWIGSVKKPIVKIAGAIGIIASAAIILTSISRSNIVSLGAVLFLVIVLHIRFSQNGNHGKAIGKKTYIIGLVIAILLLVVVLVSTGGIFNNEQLISSPLNVLLTHFNSILDNPRVVMYNNALLSINERVLFGYGIGKVIEDGAGNYSRVHNLFLASWVESGLAGFLLSTAWYISIVFYLFNEIRNFSLWESTIPKEWVMALPILPLFRVLVSGGGGFTLYEWLFLAVFFGIILGGEQLNKNKADIS